MSMLLQSIHIFAQLLNLLLDLLHCVQFVFDSHHITLDLYRELQTHTNCIIQLCTHIFVRIKPTSDTSLWQLSTDLVSSCSCVRISHSATVVSICLSPRWSSSSLADRFILMTLTCFCKLEQMRIWYITENDQNGRGRMHAKNHNI